MHLLCMLGKSKVINTVSSAGSVLKGNIRLETRNINNKGAESERLYE
jgi:hypothetical protein